VAGVYIYTQTVHRIQRTEHTLQLQGKKNSSKKQLQRQNNNYKEKIGKCGPSLIFASDTLAFALQLRKKHGKPSVRVVEKCPDIPVAVVQYTFTHKQYKEQHNDTERDKHNNKNIYIYTLYGNEP
jgi:hypothetical protein